MIYGYARVSTMKQNLERQLRNIKEMYPNAVIITDKFTGAKMERPNWTKLEKALQPGDIVVFDSVSRMSRNAEEGFAMYQKLFNEGIELIFLKERHIDTATYKKALEGQIQLTVNSGHSATDELIEGMGDCINRYLMALAKEQIRIAFEQAEKELLDTRQRIKEGLETARIKGKQVGQVQGAKLKSKKAAEMKEQILKKSASFGGTLADNDLIKVLGIARGSFYKYKRELRAELDGGQIVGQINIYNVK